MSRRKRRKKSDKPQPLGFIRDAESPVFRRNTDLRPNTLESDSRRVRSILTTEDPALVYDFARGEIVLEILLMSGCEFESQTPLIRDHNQYTVDSIVGSVTDHEIRDDGIEGWLCFGNALDDVAEGTWRRVEQGHLRRVSVGYHYDRGDYITIPAGESATVRGRSFTAPEDRNLRVTFRWKLHEVSLVVIPADPRAQMRGATQQGTPSANPAQSSAPANDSSGTSHISQSGEDTMKKFLQFLHKHGLSKSVTNAEEALAWASKGNLTAAQLDELAKLCKSDEVSFDRGKAVASVETSDPVDEPAPPTHRAATGGSGGSGHNATVDPQRAAADAVAAERTRVAAIRALHEQHPDVPVEVRTQAESEGWTLERTNTEFLDAIRSARQQGVPPAGHVRGSEQLNLRVLQAALLAREGITPDSPVLSSPQARTVAQRRELQAGWMCNVPESGQRRDELEQAFDIATQRGLAGASLIRMAEAIVELETNQRFYNEHEIIERAFSSGGFTAVYGSVVHMTLMASYASTAATYQEFCQLLEVGDFRDHTEADMGAVGRLKRQGKNGGKAALLNVDDPVLSKIAAQRYAGMLKLTDQMIIDDTLGVTGFLPAELGETCRNMISDLAWAQVLRSDNLSDGRARYNATDGNLISAATFNEAALTALGVALKAKKIGDRRIAINEGVLAAGLTHSPTVRKQMNSETIDEARNPHAGTYRTVEDSAIDLGVSDPAQDDAVVAGTPNAIYAFAGSDLKRSISVAFRRGTNFGPMTRSGMLSEGEWGMYWDVYMDMGAAFRRRTGTVRVNITG